MILHRATQYAKDVLEGRIIAGKYVRLACERHLNDLKRQGTEEFPYVFNEDKATEIIEYAETLFIAEGDTKEYLKLAPFQAFIFSNLHGWVHRDTGYRRFRQSYIQVGRQQGKSLLNGVLGTFYGNFTDYKHGQLFCVATKMEQAKIVLNEMIKFIRSDDELEELFKIMEYKSEIHCLNTGSKIKALGRDSKSIDGFRPYLGVVDEYHAHKNNQMFKQLEGGTGNLKECLISVITTAGFDLNSPCFEMYEYSKQILEGAHSNETRFIYIAELDKDDDIWDPENWVKSCPLTCSTPEGREVMKDIGKTAKAMGGEDLRDFMTKRLNQWVSFSNDQYISYDDWKECESDLTLEDFRGQEAWAGLDLSSGGDLTSLSFVFPYQEDGSRKYYIHSHSFIPKKRVAEHIMSDNAPYDMWIKDGLLTPTEALSGIKTDYKYIIKYLNDLSDKYDIRINTICYDPHNASAFLYDLDELGLDTIDVLQTHKSLNDATVDFRLEVKAGNVTFNRNNKLLTWSVINAKTVSNPYGEIKVDKKITNGRIDPVDAVIDAWKFAMRQEIDLNQYVDDAYLDKLGW